MEKGSVKQSLTNYSFSVLMRLVFMDTKELCIFVGEESNIALSSSY